MNDKTLDVKAKDIKVGDMVGISICTYFGWERVSEVTPQQNGEVKISTGFDYALYDPEKVFQVKIPDESPQLSMMDCEIHGHTVAIRHDSGLVCQACFIIASQPLKPW
mgnify:CR=1 FL=1